MNSYFLAVISGLLTYLVMLIDAYYIDTSIKKISPKIPLFVTLMIWLMCEFVIIAPVPVKPVLMGGFYKS